LTLIFFRHIIEKEMTESDKKLTRLPVKWIRDGIKKNYKEREDCFICGSNEVIELHHIYSISELWNNWLRENKLSVNCDADVLDNRSKFEQDNLEKLSNDNLYSLCKVHHLRLHQIYGKSYSNYMGERVREWIYKQRDKHGDRQKWQVDQ
jgi:hypothetical protein